MINGNNEWPPRSLDVVQTKMHKHASSRGIFVPLTRMWLFVSSLSLIFSWSAVCSNRRSVFVSLDTEKILWVYYFFFFEINEWKIVKATSLRNHGWFVSILISLVSKKINLSQEDGVNMWEWFANSMFEFIKLINVALELDWSYRFHFDLHCTSDYESHKICFILKYWIVYENYVEKTRRYKWKEKNSLKISSKNINIKLLKSIVYLFQTLITLYIYIFLSSENVPLSII